MELVLTSHRYRERELLEALMDLGRFQKTDFKDAIRGDVEDVEVFLKELEKRSVLSLSKVVPIDKSFQFSPRTVVEEFGQAITPLLDRIRTGESFCVKVGRRGLKGLFSSQQVAKELGTFISTLLEERDGEKPKVNLEDPDKAVIFETLSRWCGVGIISKEMRKKHSCLRLP